MRDEQLDLLIGLHDGAHFIETPNPVMVMSGFKSLGAAALLLRPDGSSDLIVTPAWDAERAAECCPDTHVLGATDVVEGLSKVVDGQSTVSFGLAGLCFLPCDIADRVTAAFPQA